MSLEGRGGEGRGGDGRGEMTVIHYSNGTTIFKYRLVLRNNVIRHLIGATPNNGR